MADQMLYDRVRTTTAVTGTGDAAMSAVAPDGYQTPQAVYGAGEKFPYAIGMEGSTEWEAGEATLTGNTLNRSTATIYASSNAGALVNFSTGLKYVIVGLNAERANLLNATRGMILALQSNFHLQ